MITVNNLKNILVFFGSPHKNGYTRSILNAALDLIPDKKITFVSAYDRNVSPCIDCGFCKINEACIFDDMDDIDQSLRECDTIIIASPVYNFSFPSPLKAVIDRMQRYYCSYKFLGNKFFTNKKALIILTQGSNHREIEKNISKQIFRLLNLLGASKIEMISVVGTDQKNFNIQKVIFHQKRKMIKKINNLYS